MPASSSLSRTKLSGRSLVGFREGKGAGEAMYAVNPLTGERLPTDFLPATAEEVEAPVPPKDANPLGIWRMIDGEM